MRQWLEEDNQLHIEGVTESIIEHMEADYLRKEAEIGVEDPASVSRSISCCRSSTATGKSIWPAWTTCARAFICVAMPRRTPQEYKKEAFELFQNLLNQIQHELVRVLHNFQVRRDDELERMEQQRQEEARRQAEKMSKMQAAAEPGTEPAAGGEEPQHAGGTVVREGRKVGRNEPCPCGSGKKYKQCHGKIE